MSTVQASDRFTSLPDDQALAATVVALEEHGFSVEVIDDSDAARAAVLARIPAGSSVMTNTSVTLDQTGIADAINEPFQQSLSGRVGAGRREGACVVGVCSGQRVDGRRIHLCPTSW